MPTKSRPSAWAVLVAGGLLALTACGGGGGGGSPDYTAAFAQSLDKLCAADWAVNSSVPSLEAAHHLTDAQIQAKVKAAGQAFTVGKAHLTPPANLTAAWNSLNQDSAKALPSASLPPATWAKGMITHERAIANDYTALGATGCASIEERSIAGLEEFEKPVPSPSG